jgi:hypothetical protein
MITVEWFEFRAKKHTMALVVRLLMVALLAATLPAQAQGRGRRLLVAHPQFRDLDYRQTVLLASPAPERRPRGRDPQPAHPAHAREPVSRPRAVEESHGPVYYGGPFSRGALVALVRPM